MNRLYESIAELNRGHARSLVVMGDLIDADSTPNALRLLREVSALCDSFQGGLYYMPGNHDLDHLSKAQFYNALGHAGSEPAFRFREGPLDFICIDGNFSTDGTEYDQGNFQWKQSFVPERQLAWLRYQLDDAQAPVVILTHQRIDIPSEFSVQNHDAVREVIRLSGKVKAVIQGHQHADDLRQIDGTPYYTLSAHKDGAGPAVVQLDAKGLRLFRDFQALEPA
jgi:UDP-2,3-diacylglucosamine pyrophosphatase LpxH